MRVSMRSVRSMLLFLESIGAWRHFDASRLTPNSLPCVFLAMREASLSFRHLNGCFRAGLDSRVIVDGLRVLGKRQATKQPHAVLPAKPAQLEFRQDAALLTLSDGSTMLSAKLLVGADGRDSWVRQAAGLAAVNTPYGEKGLVANFSQLKSRTIILPINGSEMMAYWLTCRYPGTAFPSCGPP
jgi:2-octaprenylphenol hydroxylase